jgi:hypothetical protein
VSSNQSRKARRQQAREWSYEQYAQAKREAANLERAVMAKAKVTGEMIVYLRAHVPSWAVHVAIAICPKTLDQLAFLFVSVLPRLMRVRMSEYMMAPGWLCLLATWPIDIVAIILGIVIYRPLKYIQGMFLRFGHTTSITTSQKRREVRMTVRNFWLVPVQRATVKF